MKQTKKCIHCKQEIDKKAKVCPLCQKKQGAGCLSSIIVSVMVFLFVFFGIGIGVSSCADKMTSGNSEINADRGIERTVVTAIASTTAETTTLTTVTTTTEITTVPETTTTTEPPTEPPTLPPTEPPTEPPTPAPTEPPAPVAAEQNNLVEYWINTDSGKFHYSNCRTIKNEDDPHWERRWCDRQELIAEGYSPCGVCEP